MTVRPARQAWGLACHGDIWCLVGLFMPSPHLVRVHTSQQRQALPGETSDLILGDLLREAGRATGRAGRRVSLALSSDQSVSGVLALPAQLPEEDWPAEIQLEVSQMLGMEPDEVNFDFQRAADSDGLVQRVHWVGCAHSQIASFKSGARAAGWQLDSVEPAIQAAERAASALHGGLASLLTQPAQDWQFHMPSQRRPGPEPEGSWGRLPDPALVQAMKTEAGARLVASGLALKAWC